MKGHYTRPDPQLLHHFDGVMAELLIHLKECAYGSYGPSPALLANGSTLLPAFNANNEPYSQYQGSRSFP